MMREGGMGGISSEVVLKEVQKAREKSFSKGIVPRFGLNLQVRRFKKFKDAGKVQPIAF